jgi:hypothetical protein
VQGLLVFQEGRPILERHLIQPMGLGLGDLLDLVNRLPGRLPDCRRGLGDRLLKILPTSTTNWASSVAAVTIPTRASRARGSMTWFCDSFRWVALSGLYWSRVGFSVSVSMHATGRPRSTSH